MDENPEEVAVDIDTEVEEDTNISEEGVEDTEVQEEEEVVPKKQYDQVFSRTKKAEAELKKLKEAKEISESPELSDELRLIARGLSDEEIDKAKVIAKGNDISLQEALKDDMFKAYQAKMALDKKKEEAKLGASKGSGESPDKTLVKPDMSRDDHEKVFKKVMGISK